MLGENCDHIISIVHTHTLNQASITIELGTYLDITSFDSELDKQYF